MDSDRPKEKVRWSERLKNIDRDKVRYAREKQDKSFGMDRHRQTNKHAETETKKDAGKVGVII